MRWNIIAFVGLVPPIIAILWSFFLSTESPVYLVAQNKVSFTTFRKFGSKGFEHNEIKTVKYHNRFEMRQANWYNPNC